VSVWTKPEEVAEKKKALEVGYRIPSLPDTYVRIVEVAIGGQDPACRVEALKERVGAALQGSSE